MRTVFIIIVFLSLPMMPAWPQGVQLPTDPLAGRLVFEDKGCIQCHALAGYGADVGPDLGRDLFFGSPLELSSILWNHIPEMNRKYRQFGLKRPSLTEADLKDLAGFLYYLRYLGEPGSVATGRRLLKEKMCLSCHRLHESGVGIGPAFPTLQEDVSPLNLVQTMWNHGPEMQEKLEEQHLGFPYLNDNDIGDISAYLQMAVAHKRVIRMPPGDPSVGRKVFIQKHCSDCHTVDRDDPLAGPDFHTTDLRRSVTEIAGIMWNHSPSMLEHMRKKQISWPMFEGREMADVIAYLYFLGFREPPGDSKTGKKIFKDKGCSSCHTTDQEPVTADLRRIGHIDSPLALFQRMWSHAEEMEDRLLAENRRWPRLSRQDMLDLYSFFGLEVADD